MTYFNALCAVFSCLWAFDFCITLLSSSLHWDQVNKNLYGTFQRWNWCSLFPASIAALHSPAADAFLFSKMKSDAELSDLFVFSRAPHIGSSAFCQRHCAKRSHRTPLLIRLLRWCSQYASDRQPHIEFRHIFIGQHTINPFHLFVIYYLTFVSFSLFN